MYKMCWKISIGNYNLKMIESVNVKRSVELLADTATTILPATVFNKSLNIEIDEKIKRGDPVNIELGYDEKLVPEFEGYVESISTDGGSLTINCEDGIFLYRVKIPDKELTNANVKDILKYPDIQTGKVGEADCYLINARVLMNKALEQLKEDPYYFVSPSEQS